MIDKKQKIREILSNERCCICARRSEIVCNECLADNQPACFCEKHQARHGIERYHIAYWGKLCE